MFKKVNENFEIQKRYFWSFYKSARHSPSPPPSLSLENDRSLASYK